MKNENQKQITRQEKEMDEYFYNSLKTSEQKKLRKKFKIQLTINFNL